MVELLLPSHDATVSAADAGEVDLLPHLGPADVGVAAGGLRTVVTRSRREEFLVPDGLEPAIVTALSLATDRSALIPGAYPLARGRNLALARLLLNGARPQVHLAIPCNDAVRANEAGSLSAQWQEAGVTTQVSCGPAAGPVLRLTADQAPAPAGAVPLLLWPGVRAVSPRLHGFLPNDTSATDFWNAADWWLS